MMQITKSLETIGTDASLEVCRREGYLMAEYDFSKPFDKENDYRVFCHYPPYTKLTGLRTDSKVSWSELVKLYYRYKPGLDSFADDMPEIMSKRNPTIYDLLHAADTIEAFVGLP